MQDRAERADVAIIMGSRSDWATMRPASDVLTELGIPCRALVISAHRTPERLFAFCNAAHERGYRVIIAGAGGAAHLPGMLAALLPLPVLGVPVQSRALNGLDSLLSIVQMPAGVPVGTFAIGEPGARNAALFAAAILALGDPALARRLADWRRLQGEAIPETPEEQKPEAGSNVVPPTFAAPT
jgi:5-(carboxyamino)imidazole ribonucleotide mutase